MQSLTLKIILAITSLLILSQALSACTPPDQPVPTPLSVEPTAEPEPTETAEPTPVPTDAPTTVPSIEIVDGLGRSIMLAGPAQKIISLAPSNTEILFAIGAGGQVVARDTFSDYPQAALDLTDIGGGWGEIDLETVISLEPDLILAADLTAPEQIQSLEDLGINVFALGNPNDIEGMYTNLRIAAQLTGHEAETEALIGDLQARVAAVVERMENVDERPLVFYELDGTDPNAPWTSGVGTFVDTLLTMAGADNLGSQLADPWVQISIEELVLQDPDIILLGDAIWGGVTPEDVAARAGWESLSAVQNDGVVPFDDNLVSRPGPRLVDGLEQLARLLHPEQF